MAGVCILLHLTVAGISYIDIEKSPKNGEVQIFRKTPFWVFAYHVGLAVTTFSVAHVGVLGSLSHQCPFVNCTMWASFLRAFCLNSPLRSQGLGTLVVTVPCDFVARHTTAALLSITLLSWLHNVLPVASRPIRLLTRYLLHLSYDWSLCLAQLTPAYGVTSFRFVQAATALHHQHSVAFVASAGHGYASFFVAFCLFFFLVPSTIVLQHVIVPSTDSPAFALSFNSWRILCAVY